MPIDAAALAKLETVLTAAVKACLGLPADDRVGFIARYVQLTPGRRSCDWLTG